MEFVVNEISQSEKEVEVTLNYDEIKNEIDDEVKKQARNIQVPGFRKGKVPKNILKQRYGNALEFEASEKVANARFWSGAVGTSNVSGPCGANRRPATISASAPSRTRTSTGNSVSAFCRYSIASEMLLSLPAIRPSP